MAFRPLTDAECGQTNPLSKLTSHVLHDHAFTENHGQMFPSSSDQLVEQFLQETRTVPQTYRMDDLMREMHEIESQRSVLPPIPASTVKDQLHDDAWAQQYIDDGKVFHHNDDHEEVWTALLSQEQEFTEMDNVWDSDQVNNELQDEHGAVIRDSARELGELAADDPKFVYSKFMKFMKNVEDGEVNLEEGKLTEQEAEAWSAEYSKSAPDKVAQEWVDEHTKTNVAADEFNSQFWSKLQEEMKSVTYDNENEHPWFDEYNSLTAPQKEYEFSETNPMLDVENPLARGKELLEEGDFPSAVLCFEAAVKNDPENAEAWLLLGCTQAENEQDPSAIPALNRCLQLEPTNLKALMSLAVSYTNENYFNQACHMLLNWLRHNPKYSDLVPENLTLTGTDQKIVQDLYIKAAQRHPMEVDHEVQSGLGVLFNVTGEYDKAADCFQAAVSVRPDDARLWNRLGATLANGSKAEEAVTAYHEALNIAPGFIRSRYNVGITCMNLNAYKEAAEHFLTALNQQARGAAVTKTTTMSQMSETIWSTLRMCVSLMNRADLKPAVDNRDLDTLNKAFDIADN